jgi:hypothetical protein
MPSQSAKTIHPHSPKAYCDRPDCRRAPSNDGHRTGLSRQLSDKTGASRHFPIFERARIDAPSTGNRHRIFFVRNGVALHLLKLPSYLLWINSLRNQVLFLRIALLRVREDRLAGTSGRQPGEIEKFQLPFLDRLRADIGVHFPVDDEKVTLTRPPRARAQPSSPTTR